MGRAWTCLPPRAGATACSSAPIIALAPPVRRREGAASRRCAAAALTLAPYALGIYPGWPFGRYALVALLPLAVLHVYGIAWWSPARWRALPVMALLLIMALLDGYALFYALPTHFTINAPGV